MNAGAAQSQSQFAKGPQRLIVLAVPGRRIELLADAIKRLGLPAPVVIPWIDLLADRINLKDFVRAGDVVRIESPGKDFETEKALLSEGARALASKADTDFVAANEVCFDKGRIVSRRQWYAGFCAALAKISLQLAQCKPHFMMSDLVEIAVMFDKRQCHARLREAGISVPPALGPIDNYDELVARMRADRCRRVFVKSAHGSSASGIVAYQMSDTQEIATTTVEMQQVHGELRLYNSRVMRTYRNRQEIATLINALCRQGVHVERWLPKAGISGCAFDLRVVVIGGRARHVVVRMSKSPMTNLHLLNKRGDITAVRQRVGDAIWDAALRESERAMAAFPRSLYGGVDVMITADHRRVYVLEVNAFGDLLPGVQFNGLETYDAELAAVMQTNALSGREVA